jgi:endonuclease-3
MARKSDLDSKIDWNKALKPLFRKYRRRKHPLEYKSLYQLLVMVVLSARDSDRHINALAPALFEKFPSMRDLARARTVHLYPFIRGVTNFRNKAKWLTETAKRIRNGNIPQTLEELIQYPGIGRKSANVIMHQMNASAEGVIVDLHSIRVVPRLGIANGTNPEKIEKQLMAEVAGKNWHALGMSLTYLGREICRPTNPKCPECVMNKVCRYCNSQNRGQPV